MFSFKMDLCVVVVLRRPPVSPQDCPWLSVGKNPSLDLREGKARLAPGPGEEML